MNPELFLYTEIGDFGISAEDFISQLKTYNGQRVTLRINSPGGSVFEGAAIYNAVKRHPGGVDVVIDGLAASMASVIACGGETVAMAANALFMIHNPWTGAVGDAEDLRREADLLDKVKETIVQSYVGKSGMSAEDVTVMMDNETWLNAEQALEAGFIDSISESLKAAAKFDLSRFKNAVCVDRSENSMSESEILNETAEAVSEVVAEVAAEIVETVEAVEETIETPAVQEEAAPEQTEEAVTALAETPEVDQIVNRISAERVELEQLRNEASQIRAELQSLRANEASMKAEVLKANDLYNKLKKSYGLAPADVVPVIPVSNNAGDIVDEFESLTGAEASAFFKKNRSEIRKAYANRR